MKLTEVLEYYSRKDVQDALLEIAKDREVVGVFKNGSFDTRPNTIIHANDIIAMVKTGVLEFHCSIEKWQNPMAIKEGNYDEQRRGWDILLDLDCKIFDHGKIAAKVVCNALVKHGIENFSLKYTGGKGFHIGIPWESIPRRILSIEKGKDELQETETVKLYPELARKVCEYIKDYIREDFIRELLNYCNDDLEALADKLEKPVLDLFINDEFDPYKIVDIDPVLISPRHLFRMPYSLNKKTWLVSLPLKLEDLDSFEREQAEPKDIEIKEKFLLSSKTDEVQSLLSEALDWKIKTEEKTKRKKLFVLDKAVPKEMFPPCIKRVLEGNLTDGRKRSVFILTNFLKSVKWSWSDIENLIHEWNEKNNPPLRDSYVRGQLRHSKGKPPVLPPNCNNQAYYVNYGICLPDHVCKSNTDKITIKNPANYPFRVMKKK